jgi:hypothetical protein
MHQHQQITHPQPQQQQVVAGNLQQVQQQVQQQLQQQVQQQQQQQPQVVMLQPVAPAAAAGVVYPPPHPQAVSWAMHPPAPGVLPPAGTQVVYAAPQQQQQQQHMYVVGQPDIQQQQALPPHMPVPMQWAQYMHPPPPPAVGTWFQPHAYPPGY